MVVLLLGLKGVVVKSHGGISAEGFAYAVDVGYEMVRCDLLTKINQMLIATAVRWQRRSRRRLSS